MSCYNFDYEITKQDLKLVSKDIWKVSHYRKIQRNFIIITMIFTIIAIASIFMPTTIFDIIFFPLICIILYLIFLLFIIRCSAYFNLKKLLKGTNLKRSIIIDDSGIKQMNSTCTSTLNWSGIINISNQKHSILLFLGDRIFILLPKRIFANEEELNNCWNYIQDCYNKTRA